MRHVARLARWAGRLFGTWPRQYMPPRLRRHWLGGLLGGLHITPRLGLSIVVGVERAILAIGFGAWALLVALWVLRELELLR